MERSGSNKITAIIADDEKKICQLILKLGNWDELGIEVMEICTDGKMAWDAIERHHPDIVVTDIQMPIYDGLELVQKSREAEINSIFIIISGYRHFEYAHKALQYGVADYLLKPLSQDQLKDTLTKVSSIILEKRNNIDREEYLNQIEITQINSKMEVFWEKMLESNSRITVNAEDMKKEYGMELVNSTIQIMCITTNQPSLHTEESLFGQKAKQIAGEYIKHSNVFYHLDKSGRGMFFLLNYQYGKRNLMKEQVMKLFYELKNLSEIYGDFKLTIGCGVPIEIEFGSIRKAVESAVLANNARLIDFGDGVIEAESIQLKEFPIDKVYPLELKKKHKQAVLALDKEKIKEIQEELWSNCIHYRYGNPQIMLQLFQELMNTLKEAFPDKEQIIGVVSRCRSGVCTARNLEHLLEIYFNNAILGIDEILMEREQLESVPIRTAKQHMNQNYREATLESAAKLAGVSTVYLSRLFKEHTSQNFVDYLIEVRIEHSKELLINTNHNIAVIASMVGYNDDKHFTKLFKRQTGITPTEYRKLYSF